MSDQAIGLSLAAASAILNGSFAVFSKLPQVRAAGDPAVAVEDREQAKAIMFTCYTCLGVFISSWFVAPFIQMAHELDGQYAGSPTYQFTGYGIIAGILLVVALTASFAAIPLVGISVGQGVWGGVAILVSFLWGTVVFHEENKITYIPGVLLALMLLLGGVVVVALCEPIAELITGGNNSSVGMQQSAVTESGSLLLDSEQRIPVRRSSMPAQAYKQATHAAFYRGIGLAVIVGLAGGSILVPMKLAPDEYNGLVIVPSFGFGAALGAPIATAIFFCSRSPPVVPELYPPIVLPGMAAGAVWNLGNVASIFATNAIGYAVAYPIMQSALFFGGLWGIFVFGEIKNPAAIYTFFSGGAALIAGAALLAIFIKNPES